MSGSGGCPVHASPALDCPRCFKVRSADAWSAWVASRHKWDLFGGLTFDQRPAKRGVVPLGEQRGGARTPLGERLTEDGSVRLAGKRRMGREVAIAHLRAFCGESEQLLGRATAAVVGLEYHRNGWPHFHPLIAIEGGLDAHGREIATLGTWWFERFGGNRLSEVRDPHQAGAYASKYLAKDLDQGDVFFWPERGPIRGFGRSMWQR